MKSITCYTDKFYMSAVFSFGVAPAVAAGATPAEEEIFQPF